MNIANSYERFKRTGIKEELPCAECWPECLPENKKIVEVFLYSMNQLQVSPKGKIIGVNMNYVFCLMDLLEVKDRRRCLDKIIELSQRFVVGK
ncbi:MAG: hypothetical protein ACXACY_24260 [Candidatus Hodarchaeales archaeon]